MSDDLLTLEQARLDLAWYTKWGQVPGDVLHKALRTAIAALEAQEWRPIETAKLGDELLLRGAKGQRTVGVRLDPTGYWFAIDYKTVLHFAPTHWMPLPQPPKE